MINNNKIIIKDIFFEETIDNVLYSKNKFIEYITEVIIPIETRLIFVK
jgi:hypothetical protein